MGDQILNKILENTIGITQNEEEEEKETAVANNVEEQQKEQADAPIASGELARTQEKIPGVSGILAPVEDVTELITAWTKQKLAPIDAAKKITDLTYANRQKNEYIEKLQKLTEEAMQRGDKNVIVPMMPQELLNSITTKKETDGETDIEDSKFMRDSLRLITQHEMLLKAQDRISGSSGSKEEPRDWIEVAYPDGTTFKGPAHLAPQPVQQQPQNIELTQILSTLVERVKAIEESSTNPYRGQPMIRIPTGEKDENDDPIYADVPMAEAMRYGLMSQSQQPQAPPANDEKLTVILEQLAGRGNNQPTAEEIIGQIEARSELEDKKMDREILHMQRMQEIFNPRITKPNPETGIDETAVRTAQIKAQAEVDKAKIEKESKTLDLVKSALEPDPTLIPQPQKKSDKQIGREFLLNVQERARREGVPM